VGYVPHLAQTGDIYENPQSGTRLEILELSPDRLRFERRYPSGTGRADPHVHLDFTQGWEVGSGTATIAVDGEARRLQAGDGVEIAEGTRHQDPYNEGTEPLVVRWTIEPVTEFVHGFLNAYAHLLGRDELNDQDEFPMLQLFVILRSTGAQSFAADLPVGLQRLTLPLLAAVGRMRGYRPSY
jgi:mannose-6-phosphate isomerase-like protein (cupin superfamily)